MMKHIPIILIITFCCVGSVFGQTKKAYLKAADKAMVINNYYEALTFYNEALEFNENDPAVLYKSAEAARKFKAYDMAATRYATLLDTLSNKTYPDAYIEMGKVLVAQGDYDKAKTYLDTYLDEYSGRDTELTKEVRMLNNDVQWAIDRKGEIDKSAEIDRLGDNVNSPESDFGTTIHDGALYFTTMKYREEGTDRKIPRAISKIHKYADEEGMMIEGDLNSGNSLKANPSISKDGKWMFYTICDYNLQDKISCDIYKREIIDADTYGEAEKLGLEINAEGSTSTHPHIAYDKETDRNILYFVSNRSGGKGGMDIYYSIMNASGDLSVPIALDEVNTEGDDVTPFHSGPDNKLYFASNGRRGLGGFDIYSYDMDHPDSDPEHMQAPVNSSYDDLYFVWDVDKGISYFSSNRAASKRLDDVTDACCFDIYRVAYNDVVIDLNALTYDKLTERPLKGATVFLIDAAKGDTVAIVNLDGNDHEFVLKRGVEYQLIAKRKHYDDAYVDLSTAGITESQKMEEKIYMYTPKTQVKIFTFDNKTKAPLSGTRLVVRNTSDNTFETIDITNLQGNDYYLYLPPGHKYDIVVTKFGYVDKRDAIDLSGSTKPGIIEKNVYLDVFEIEEYRDTDVYFENDFPNPKSNSTNTDIVYGDHFADYIRNKEDYFKRVRKSRSISDKELAIQQLDAFFEGEVVGGYDMFKRFMRALKKELELGRSLVVELKGYASPLADSKYNRALSSRRVNSVRNEMMRYDGGVFRQYLADGRLIIHDVSYGDERAPADVSADKNNTIESIYSVKAARERRVEIIRIKDQ